MNVYANAGIFGRLSIIFLFYILRVSGSVLAMKTSVWSAVFFLILFRKILNFCLKYKKQFFLPYCSQSSIHHPLVRLYMFFAIIILIDKATPEVRYPYEKTNIFLFIF